jgi:hypothetical protein
MMDGSVIEDLGGGAFSSFLGKETKINKHIYICGFFWRPKRSLLEHVKS